MSKFVNECLECAHNGIEIRISRTSDNSLHLLMSRSKFIMTFILPVPTKGSAKRLASMRDKFEDHYENHCEKLFGFAGAE